MAQHHRHDFFIPLVYTKTLFVSLAAPTLTLCLATCSYLIVVCYLSILFINKSIAIIKLHLDTHTWTEITLTEPPVASPRCSHSALATHHQESMVIVGGATDSDLLDAHEFVFGMSCHCYHPLPPSPSLAGQENYTYVYLAETRKWIRIELTTQGIPRQGHSAVLRGESIFLFGGLAGANHNQLDLLSLGSKDEFEDEFFHESAQDEEVARAQSLPRSLWEAILLKKHPDILQYRELTRNVTGVRTYARSRPCATTEDPAHLNHQLVLNLIVEYMHSQGCSRTANAIIEESRIPCILFPVRRVRGTLHEV